MYQQLLEEKELVFTVKAVGCFSSSCLPVYAEKNIFCCINSIEMHLADDRELIYTYTNTTHTHKTDRDGKVASTVDITLTRGFFVQR